MHNTYFRTAYGENLFNAKYAMFKGETWKQRMHTMVDYVCGKGPGHFKPLLSSGEIDELKRLFTRMKIIPGGRYIWYGGRESRFYNNCYTRISTADTREDWAELVRWATDCLMMGGGIGNNYDIYRPKGSPLKRTGGEASGPMPLMSMVDKIGSGVKQGGGRRAAIYASLYYQHGDIWDFLRAKDWKKQIIGPNGFSIYDAKAHDFNYQAPLENTNMSIRYDEQLHNGPIPDIFVENVKQAMIHGEPGFQFDFYKTEEKARNACTEVVSSDPFDVCNLGSVNLANINNIFELWDAAYLLSKFLYCGTVRAMVPPEVKVYRERNRRLGVGLMGVHEWLLKHDHKYEMNGELRKWMEMYKVGSEAGGNNIADKLGLPRPVAYRAIAPTGTISSLAGTTSGIEPIFAVAYKRRWMHGDKRNYQHVIDLCAQNLIENHGVAPEAIETSYDLAKDPPRRIKFQADMQDYVDQAISSTINLPAWGSEYNNEDHINRMVDGIYTYAPRLRGITFYADGSRPGQPLTEANYYEAKAAGDVVLEENSEKSCKSGVCSM